MGILFLRGFSWQTSGNFHLLEAVDVFLISSSSHTVREFYELCVWYTRQEEVEEEVTKGNSESTHDFLHCVYTVRLLASCSLYLALQMVLSRIHQMEIAG